MLTRSDSESAPAFGGSAALAEIPLEAGKVVLRSGETIEVRPLVAGDEAAIAEWFAGLGEQTRYARFLAPLKQLDSRVRAELARVDHSDHEAISAVAPDGTTVGIARYIRMARSDTAEVAVAVADDWRGRGIASTLLDCVAERARANGIESLAAPCLASNHAIIRLLARLGHTTVGPADTGLVDVHIDLTRPSSLEG